MLALPRRLCLLAALSVLFAAPLPSATTTNPPQHIPSQRQQVTGVSNFSKVTPHLYRGAQPHGAGYQELKKMGVDMVVDFRLSGSDQEKKDVTGQGMQYVSIPWHCLFPRDKHFAQFLKLLRQNPDKTIFVHCRYGDDRTGMMIAAYRMAFEGWSAADAFKEMAKFGFHRVVCPSLSSYEKSFPERLQKNPDFKDFRPQPNNSSH